MPETTVDKHHDAFGRKDNIRSPKKAGLRPKPEAATPECAPEEHLWLCVAPADTGHTATSLFRRHHVGHTEL